MNSWFDRLLTAAQEPELEGLTRDEAALVLELAGAAAHTAGARQFAPLATYLAGRAAAAGGPEERTAVLQRMLEAANHAGAAEQSLDL
jgi:hypothetical protein